MSSPELAQAKLHLIPPPELSNKPLTQKQMINHLRHLVDLEQFCASLFYCSQSLILQASKKSYLENGLYAHDSLGALPLAIGPLMSVEKSYSCPSTSSKFQGSTLTLLKNPTQPVLLQQLYQSDRLLIEAHEFTHAVYENMSQVNEIISIKQPKSGALLPQGLALFFKGF
mmetsp:Transcript_36532/g.56089  ORF Transcript_36532/g.56089 Transcript_36532/m.56089 type:complete len:170 (-) Transcript_36532:1346-1855(-)